MYFLRRPIDRDYDYLVSLARAQMPLEAIGAKMGYPAEEWKELCAEDPDVMALIEAGRQEGIADTYQTLFEYALGRGGRDRDPRLFQIVMEAYLGFGGENAVKPKYKTLSEDKLKQIHAIVSEK